MRGNMCEVHAKRRKEGAGGCERERERREKEILEEERMEGKWRKTHLGVALRVANLKDW